MKKNFFLKIEFNKVIFSGKKLFKFSNDQSEIFSYEKGIFNMSQFNYHRIVSMSGKFISF